MGNASKNQKRARIVKAAALAAAALAAALALWPPGPPQPGGADADAGAEPGPPAASSDSGPGERAERSRSPEDTGSAERDGVPARPAPAMSPRASAPVLTAVGGDPDAAGYRERAAALRRLGRSLPPEDVETLRAFVRQPGDAATMRPIELNALRNDALDILIQQNEVHPDIPWDLASVFRDPEQEEVWRTYVLQFFLPYWEARTAPAPGVQGDPRFDRLGEPADAAALKLTREVLAEALEERSGPLAGTALIQMSEMSGEHGAFTTGEVNEAALEVLYDGGASQASRLTALRVAADLELAEALEPARMIAQTGESTMFRMVAIAALGDLGADEDRGLLAALAAEDNPRIRTTAAKALERLKKR